MIYFGHTPHGYVVVGHVVVEGEKQVMFLKSLCYDFNSKCFEVVLNPKFSEAGFEPDYVQAQYEARMLAKEFYTQALEVEEATDPKIIDLFRVINQVYEEAKNTIDRHLAGQESNGRILEL